MKHPFGDQPFIGVFDSGVGGLSVLAELTTLLPRENFLYLGDTAHAPYGVKSREAVLARSREICGDFVRAGAKAIVIACNTATSAAAQVLRGAYDLPIVGMEPAVKPAFQQTSGRIAVIATEMTLHEEKFRKLVSTLSAPERVVSVPAPELVTLVEHEYSDMMRVREAVSAFIGERMIAHDASPASLSAVVLGCTHFVFLREEFARQLPPRVGLFDGNHGTAMRLQNLLSLRGLLSGEGDGQVVILNSDSAALSRTEDLYEALMRKQRAAAALHAQTQHTREAIEQLLEEGRIAQEWAELVRLHWIERRSASSVRRALGMSQRRFDAALARAQAQVFQLLKDRPLGDRAHGGNPLSDPLGDRTLDGRSPRQEEP